MRMRDFFPTRRDTFPSDGRAFDVFRSLRGEVERLFDEFGPGVATPQMREQWVPSLDIAETDTAIELSVELPGLEEKDIDVSVADDILTIKGEKTTAKDEARKDYRLVERTYGSFCRSIALPERVDSDAIKATMAKGVLKLTLPKLEPSESKKIPVQAAS